MFTDLLQMKTGDIFYLHVLGETLAYEVDSLNTVLPHDTSLLGITGGSDLCTLITCTPIAVNSHRLLVTGHRIPFEAAKEMVEEAQQEDTEVESTWEQESAGAVYRHRGCSDSLPHLHCGGTTGEKQRCVNE